MALHYAYQDSSLRPITLTLYLTLTIMSPNYATPRHSSVCTNSTSHNLKVPSQQSHIHLHSCLCLQGPICKSLQPPDDGQFEVFKQLPSFAVLLNSLRATNESSHLTVSSQHALAHNWCPPRLNPQFNFAYTSEVPVHADRKSVV